MLIEIDEVLVDKDLWAKTIAGNEQARDILRDKLCGLNLYFHNVPAMENEIVVSLRELHEFKVLKAITLSET